MTEALLKELLDEMREMRQETKAVHERLTSIETAQQSLFERIDSLAVNHEDTAGKLQTIQTDLEHTFKQVYTHGLHFNRIEKELYRM